MVKSWRRVAVGGLSWLISENNTIDISEKLLNNEIEILREKFEFSVERRDRIRKERARLTEEEFAADEDCAQKKRELDLAMEEKRRLTRMKLAYGDASNKNNSYR